ncbi:unnamed protein product [Leptosia nina]|uniref:Uncharacterized protein n=1 Tax=Leptosia nina TaxID=320188 RepID=A0AAV1JYS9_9NEOP
MVLLSKIKLLTFDATNTLLKFCVSPWKYYAEVAEKHGYHVKEEQIKKQFLGTYKILSKTHPNFGRESILWENWWRKIVEGTFKDSIDDKDKVKSISNILIEDYKTPKCWCAADGALDLLTHIRNQGIELGVISNFDPRLHEVLHQLNLTTYFKFVLTSYEVGYNKPDKAIFQLAKMQTKFNISSEECLHIGDDYEKDFEGAKGAGWEAILVTEDWQEHWDIKPKQCYRNLSELKKELAEYH